MFPGQTSLRDRYGFSLKQYLSRSDSIWTLASSSSPPIDSQEASKGCLTCAHFLLLPALITYFVFPSWSRTRSPSVLRKGTPTQLLGHTCETAPMDPPKIQLTCYSSEDAKAELGFLLSLVCVSQPIFVLKWRESLTSSFVRKSIVASVVMHLCLLVAPSFSGVQTGIYRGLDQGRILNGGHHG